MTVDTLGSSHCTKHWRIYIQKFPAHAPPPLWDPILSFSHTFSPKSAHVGGPQPCPQMGPHPPLGNPGSAPAKVSKMVPADVERRGLAHTKVGGVPCWDVCSKDLNMMTHTKIR